jgi:hypothetical protein
VDYHYFSSETSSVMDGVNNFLGIHGFEYSTEFVFNSRNNRGVHGQGSNFAVGGTINGKSKLEIGVLDQWTDGMESDLSFVFLRYYTHCNRELHDLLGDSTPTWAVS